MPNIFRPQGWWGKTQSAVERLMQEGKIKMIEGKFFYEDRPLIHKDSSIDGGVYLGEGIREAIVVDFQRSPYMQKAYQEARERCLQDTVFLRERILCSVYDRINDQLRWDETAVEKIVRQRGLQKDGKISLEVFFRERVGVCRHQGLACAALLEQFIKEGYIRGKVSVDRNATDSGNHVWCRYTNADGKIIILDVAQHFFGYLHEAVQEHRWLYERPSDF